MKASFKVRQDLAYWSCDAGQFAPGSEHEVSGSKNVMRAIAAAQAAGSVHSVTFDDAAAEAVEGTVQSQKESEKALVAAMGEVGPDGRYSGPWMEGHLAQLELEGDGIEVGSDE